MKQLKYIFSILATVSLLSCDYDLDPITEIAPGVDASAPELVISYPTEGTFIRVPEEFATITIKFETTDDIELSTVDVKIDGASIASYDSFTDYRRFLDEIVYDQVASGNHQLAITATDLDGKATTKTVNFTKASPYSPKYSGEEFYFPFDGSIIDLVTTSNPVVTGSDSYYGTGKIGDNALELPADSYLSVPATAFTAADGFSASLWINLNSSPDRAGIISADFGDSTSRKQGFRLFRENAGGKQRIKANIGVGTKDHWVDGGSNADVVPDNGVWTHLGLTVSADTARVYINGTIVKEITLDGPMDWTDVQNIVIGAGGPSFSYWNHKTDQSGIDEVRLFSTALTTAEMISVMGDQGAPTYVPDFDSEVFYMPFEGDYKDFVNAALATEVGDTDFGAGQTGDNSFQGATDSYLSYPSAALESSEFTGAFWYKVNADPTRAGILTVGDDADDRKQGFRLFREGNADSQRIKLNVGTGAGESWNDGDVIDVAAGEWVHIAFTVSETKSTIYFNGVEMRSSDLAAPIDWTGCSELVIGSGGPTFSYWNHKSDSSLIDELRFFNKALTAEEISTVMNF